MKYITTLKLLQKVRTYIKKGNRLRFLGDNEGIRLTPKSSMPYCIKGQFLLEIGRDNEALVFFNDALSVAGFGAERHLSSGNKKFISQISIEDRPKLLKKITQLLEIEIVSDEDLNQDPIYGKIP